jgi:hypothetical protein
MSEEEDMRFTRLLFLLPLLVSCTTVQPPPDIALAEANITPVSQVVASAIAAANAATTNKTMTATTMYTAAVAADATLIAALPTPAQNLRKRQMLKALTILADTPEARAMAMAELHDEEEQVEENEKKLEDLLGGGFGLGLTVTFNVNDDRVESAVLVGETGKEVVQVTKDKNVVPRLLLETHYLFTTNPFRRTAKSSSGKTFNVAVAQKENCKNDENSCPMMGFGPFVGIQQTADGTSFDGLAVGATWGFRPTEKAGVSIGIGAMFDSSAKVLGAGITPGKALPAGETAIRFKETGQVNPILSVSLTF